MKTSLAQTFAPRRLFAATLLAGMGAMAFAQGAPAPAPVGGPQGGPPPQHRMQPGGPGAREHKFDPAKFADMHAKRMAEFKARLKITPQQEGAWTAFTNATQPPANRPPFDRAEFAKLTTPQRIDRMQQLKTQRDAEMAKRADATKALYAQLTPYQQGLFDAAPMHRGHGHRGHEHQGPGMHGGPQQGPARG